MPRLSMFYGVAVYMDYQDHAPPHFHAIYGEHEATFAIESGSLLEGALPRTARKLVQEWIELHRDELWTDWNLARRGLALNPIDPLD